MGVSVLLLQILAGRDLHAEVFVLDNATPTAQAVSQALTQRGVENALLPLEQITSVPALASSTLLVAPHYGACRADEASTLTAHLQNGGALLVLGEMPFEELLYPYDGGWIGQDAYLDAMLAPTVLLDMAQKTPSNFYVSTDAPQVPATVQMEPAELTKAQGSASRTSAHMSFAELSSWTTFQIDVPGTKPTSAVTTFWAKGTGHTYQLAVEWVENDNSRWIARINLSSEWRFYTLTPADFEFWYNPEVTGRGGPGDSLQTQNAKRLCVGLARTHTTTGSGPHDFWICDVGMSTTDPASLTYPPLPKIDGLYPRTTAYPISPARLETSGAFAHLSTASLAIPQSAWSTYWRPMGPGYSKDRRLRFVPVVTAYNAEGSRAGTLAALTLGLRAHFPGACYGYVSVEDDALLLSEGWMDVVAEMAKRMSWRSFFKEAGSSKFTYDVRDLSLGKVRVGARTVDMNLTSTLSPQLRITVHDAQGEVFNREWTPSPTLASTVYADAVFGGQPGELWRVRSELLADGQLLDVIEHETGFDGPRATSSYVSARERSFYKDGQPLRIFGINYLPSSGCAATDAGDFEHYVENRSYDPQIVEHDLEKIAGLGMNAISIFIYNSSVPKENLLDLLRRARAHNLHVHLSLRPATPPLAPSNSTLDAILLPLRLAEKDEVFAYDIAWEPWWGSQEQRIKFGTQWTDWVTKKYGSASAATTSWGFTPADLAAFPSNDELRVDGAWSLAVADYRRFVDETLNSSYGAAVRHIRKIDPNHLVSFRQSEGANPLADPGLYTMDLASICGALDFFSPEGYGIGDAPAKAATMLFAASYAENLATGKPLLWAEYGATVWTGDSFLSEPELLERQAQVYRNILDNAQASRSAGTLAWFYAGGYRSGEESDFGIFSPDGMPRPSAQVLAQYAAAAKAPAAPVQWTPRIEVNRDDSVRGYAGIYERVRTQFEQAITAGSIPLVATYPPLAVAQQGRFAARLTNSTPGTWTGDTGLDLGSSMVAVTAGHRLRLSFWIRGADGGPNRMLNLTLASFQGGDPTGAGSTWLGDYCLMTASTVFPNWTKYTFTYTVPANANYLNVAFRAGAANNSILIDDVHLVDLDQANAELIPNGTFESWPGESSDPPAGWRFFAVSGAQGSIERMDAAPVSRVEDWQVH